MQYNPSICTLARSAGNLATSNFATQERLHFDAINDHFIQHLNPTARKDESS